MSDPTQYNNFRNMTAAEYYGINDGTDITVELDKNYNDKSVTSDGLEYKKEQIKVLKFSAGAGLGISGMGGATAAATLRMPKNNKYNFKGINAKTSGTGPTSGVIEVSKTVKSVSQFKNYKPANPIEFVFDPKSNRFVVGRPNSSVKGLSPHQNLARSINAEKPVGGLFKRGSNGEIITNEMSGHYHRNWTPQIREQFKTFLQTQTGQSVNHISGPTF